MPRRATRCRRSPSGRAPKPLVGSCSRRPASASPRRYRATAPLGRRVRFRCRSTGACPPGARRPPSASNAATSAPSAIPSQSRCNTVTAVGTRAVTLPTSRTTWPCTTCAQRASASGHHRERASLELRASKHTRLISRLWPTSTATSATCRCSRAPGGGTSSAGANSHAATCGTPSCASPNAASPLAPAT